MIRSLKNQVTLWGKKQLQNAGVSMRYYSSVQQIYEELGGKDPAIQFFELEKISKQLELAHNHKIYNKLIQQFIPEWNLDIREAEFYGIGYAPNNLNIYRKIEIKNKVLFEKIYFSQSSLREVARNLWLEKHFYPYIKEGVKKPSIHQVFKGESITATYFDYIDLPKISKERAKAEAVEISQYFLMKSLSKNMIEGFDAAPQYLKEFRNYGHYRKWFSETKGRFEKHGIDYRRIEEEIESSRQVFSHGDISTRHLFLNRTLVDWDQLGIYPAGLEQAYIYYSTVLAEDRLKEMPLKWLEINFAKLIPEDEWTLFELTFLYFVYVFSVRLFVKKEYVNVEEYLAEQLKRRQKYAFG